MASRVWALVAALVVLNLLGWVQAVRLRRNLEADRITLERRLDSATVALTQARAAANRAAVEVRVVEARVEDRATEVRARAAEARETLADTAATVRALRVSLLATTEGAERLAAEVLTYRARVDTLLTSHLVERQAWAAERESLSALVDLERAATDAGRCSSLVGPCPTRWQSFGIGVLVAIAVVVLL